MSTEYYCEKDGKLIAKTVFYCHKHNLAFHPSCVNFHKVRNGKGEKADCDQEYDIIDLSVMSNDIEMLDTGNDETHPELTNGGGPAAPVCGTHTNEANDTDRKRKREQDAFDEESMRRVMRECMRDEVRPLVHQLEAMQKVIDDNRNEIISLKQVIEDLTKRNELLLKSNDNVDCVVKASTSYAKTVQKKTAETVLVVKPVDDVTSKGDASNRVKKHVNLQNVKTNVKIKELGVGVKSIKEKNSGAVVVRFNNVSDRENLQKSVAKNVGDKFKVEAPKVQKRYVKIVFIDKEEATLTDDELTNDIIRQNKLTETCSKVNLKIVKRFDINKKGEFSMIVEVNSELQKYLLFVEKISIGWKQCRVFEYVNLTRCYKCCGYSHHAKECKRETTCSKCGGAHNGKNCEVTELKCTNCVHMNKRKKTDEIVDVKHNAFDKECPVFIKLLENQKKRIEDTA